MSTKKKGLLFTSKDWMKHLRKLRKRAFWKGNRQATKKVIQYDR